MLQDAGVKLTSVASKVLTQSGRAMVYPKGIKVSDQQMRALPLDMHEFHPDWNYTLPPGITTM